MNKMSLLALGINEEGQFLEPEPEQGQEQGQEPEQEQTSMNEALNLVATPFGSKNYGKQFRKYSAFEEEKQDETDITSLNDEQENQINNYLLANDYTFDEIESLPLGVRYRLARSYYGNDVQFEMLDEIGNIGTNIFHKIHNYFAEPEIGFDLEAQIKQDGFTEEDKEKFFAGINNRYDYEYTKRGLQKERALKAFYNSLDENKQSQLYWENFWTGLVTGGMELALLGGAGKLLISASPAKSQQVVASAMRLLDGIPTKTLRMGASGALFGIGKVALDKMAKYEYTPEEAAMTFGMCAVTGFAFGGLHDGIKASKTVLKKIFNNDFDLSAGIEDCHKVGAKMGGMKVENFIKEDFLLTKNPASIVSYAGEYSPTAKTFITKLCDFAGDNQNYRNIENELYIEKDLKLYSFVNDFTNKLKDVDQEIINATGLDGKHWISKAVYSGQDLSNNIPHAKLLNDYIHKLYQLYDATMSERIKFNDPLVTDIGNDYVSLKYINNGGFKYEDYIKGIEKKDLFVKPRYVKRTWNYKLIYENKTDFIEKLKNIEIAHKAKELYESEPELIKQMSEKTPEMTKQQVIMNVREKNASELLEFENSGEALQIATKKYNTLTGQMKKVGHISSETMERTIRGVDEGFENYFDTPADQALIDTIVYNMGRAKMMSIYRGCGVENIEQVVAKIDTELRKGLTEDIYIKKGKKVNEIGKACRLLSQIIEGNPYAEVSPNFASNLFGAQLFLYGATLGATPLNSLCDGLIPIARFGLMPFIRSFFKGLPAVTEKGLKGYSKKEIKQILDILPFGLEDGAKASLAKNMPSVLQANYGEAYRGSKFVNAGRMFADFIYKASGQKIFENVKNEAIKKIILQDLRLHPERVKLTSEQLERMIDTGAFSDDVLMYMVHETRKTINRGKIEDIPMWVYKHPAMRLLFTYKQWVTSLTNNFTFPLLNGQFENKHVAEAFMYLFTASAMSEYLRGLRKGNKDDLTTDEGVKNFLGKVCASSLDEISGVFSIGLALTRNAYKSISRRKNPITDLLETQMPLISWGGNLVCDVTRGLSDLAILAGTGDMPKNMNKDMKRLANRLTTNLWYKDMIINNILTTD